MLFVVFDPDEDVLFVVTEFRLCVDDNDLRYVRLVVKTSFSCGCGAISTTMAKITVTSYDGHHHFKVVKGEKWRKKDKMI